MYRKIYLLLIATVLLTTSLFAQKARFGAGLNQLAAGWLLWTFTHSLETSVLRRPRLARAVRASAGPRGVVGRRADSGSSG